MMFLELHLLDNDEKIILNINRINSIYQKNGATYIYAGEVTYRVKESYEHIKELTNNCINEKWQMKSKDIAIKEVTGYSSAYPNICNLKLLPNIDRTWITIQDDVGTSMSIKLSDLSDVIETKTERLE